MYLEATLKDLRHFSKNPEPLKKSISKWSVGMHIHHCCLAMIGICKQLGISVQPPPPKKTSLARTFVFTTGTIPRGRGAAPEPVLPDNQITSKELNNLLDDADTIIQETKNIDVNKWYDHPYFSILKRDDAIKFLKIHNMHHLKIIQDILAE